LAVILSPLPRYSGGEGQGEGAFWIPMRTLVLPSTLYHQIERDGVRAYPNECCGVLIGRDKAAEERVRRIVDRLQPLTNSFEQGEQYHRFRLDPKEYMEVEKAADAEGEIVLGFYHSHPDHPARPSEYDRQHAWPFYSYVIVSIQKGSPADMTSWLLDQATEQFEKEEIVREDVNHET
jgi:proteasome lid subunit RPN8/RPN11